MNNNELRKHLKSKIGEITGWETMFELAVEPGKIPYIIFDYIELSTEDSGRHIMELTVDAWDKDTLFNVIEKIDKLDGVFKNYKAMEDGFLIQIYLGSGRGFVEDEDKTIKRLQRRYDLIVYEKGT